MFTGDRGEFPEDQFVLIFDGEQQLFVLERLASRTTLQHLAPKTSAGATGGAASSEEARASSSSSSNKRQATSVARTGAESQEVSILQAGPGSGEGASAQEERKTVSAGGSGGSGAAGAVSGLSEGLGAMFDDDTDDDEPVARAPGKQAKMASPRKRPSQDAGIDSGDEV